MKPNCIFCKLANGEIPVDFILKSEHAVVIADRNPIAPHHVLIMPKLHFGSIFDLDLYKDDEKEILSDMFRLVDDYVCMKNIANDGYRVVSNIGANAGQTVNHLHFHLIGGAKLKNDFGAETNNKA